MKIAFISQPMDGVLPPQQNSIGIWTYEVARRLAETCAVTVYARKDGALPEAVCREGVIFQPVSLAVDARLQGWLKRLRGFVGISGPLFSSTLSYLGYALRVACEIQAQGCDVIHVHNFSQFVPILKAFNPRARIVLHMHCEWLTQLKPKVVARRLLKTDLVFCCSKYISGTFQRAFPGLAGRCKVVVNGVDMRRFAGREPGDERGDTRRVLFVGRVSPEKGVHVLLEAFGKVAERCPQARLDVVGPQAAAPREYIVSLSNDPRVSALAVFYQRGYDRHLQERLVGLEERVRFVGHLPHEQVADYYRSADVLVNPSFSESFGMSLVEAMAAGVPVVGARVGGMVEVIGEDSVGLLVEPGDAEGLAEAIVRLLENEELRRTMGASGRRRVLERYTWESVTRGVLEQYTCADAGMPEEIEPTGKAFPTMREFV